MYILTVSNHINYPATDRSKYGPIGDSILNLCHALHGKNHKLFMDNYFTSLPII